MKILIVDDSRATLEIVRRGLESFGYCRLSIKKTNSPVDALKLTEEWSPDILLTDWYMPDMTGLDLIKAVVELGLEIKIGMITTVDDEAQIKEATSAGAKFVLHKPFEDSELHRCLLPLVQGVEESKQALDSIVEVQKELALPKLTQLEKLLQREISAKLELNNIQPQTFNESKVPCLMAVYEDTATQRPRAVDMLDLHAICVFACSEASVNQADLQKAITTKLVSKGVLDACQQVLGRAALAFLDSQTRKSLRLKNVSFIPTAFDNMKKLYDKELDKRIDFSCQLPGMAKGNVILVGF